MVDIFPVAAWQGERVRERERGGSGQEKEAEGWSSRRRVVTRRKGEGGDRAAGVSAWNL